MGGEDLLLLLLPPLLPCLHSHSPALVHVCQLLFTHPHLPAPIYPLLFTHFRSPILVHRSPPLVHHSHSRSAALPHLFTTVHTHWLFRSSPPRPPHFPSAPHACAPAIHSCTGSFVHLHSCCSGACFGRVIRLGSDGGPMRGLEGRGFDQSPETEHLMLGFACAV